MINIMSLFHFKKVAMATFFDDSNATRLLAEKDRGLFDTIKDWLDRFFERLSEAFKGLSANSKEAVALTEADADGIRHYIEGLQELWDQALVDAVEGGKTEESDLGNIKYQTRGLDVAAHDADALKRIGRKSVFAFTSDDIKNSRKWGEMFWDEIGEKSLFFRAWFGDWREHDNTKVNVVTESANAHGDFENKDTY